jgi:NADPH-dependent 2,4-dienoyl-CoA reductase/sulfur reductase-like enzyme/peroxiredoxin family protein/rhodanese-related sulfurtransferase/TusA-related sulfurtransferase
LDEHFRRKNNMKIMIVGGVAGGASAAARLRRLDENSEIVMFERGDYISFANCGLPYYIGGEITDKEVLTVQTPESFNARFNIDVRIGSEVVEIDAAKKMVTVRSRKGEYKENYDKLILAPGARPIKPALGGNGVDSNKIFTLSTIPDTYKIKDFVDHKNPKSAVVIGGGYIGIEMAENLHNLGIKVTVIEMLNQVIAPLDYDMACEVHNHMKMLGVRLLLGEGVSAIDEKEDGLEITTTNEKVQADMIIMAIGVRPETLIAKEAGLVCNTRGGIIVDEHMLTSNEDIYAVGDAVEVTDFVTGEKAMIPLAGPANKQGRIAADNICGITSSYMKTQGSAILKAFELTVATTGVNEKTAKKLGLDYEKQFTYSGSHAGYYPGAVNMSIKTVYEKKTGKILGAQLVGFEGVDKRCDVIATAIRAGMTAYDLTQLELCYAPPYSSAKDPVNMVGFSIENLLTGKVKNIHWHDVENLPLDGSVTLLDVRISEEFEMRQMEGFINIPLEDLRLRLSELDPSKKIYVTCQIGLRGYVAARILTQKGFDAYNLSGGTRLYNSILGGVEEKEIIEVDTQRVMHHEEPVIEENIINIDACGLQCPGPILKLSKAVKEAKEGEVIRISTTDIAFASDIEGYCRRTGNIFIDNTRSKGVAVTTIRKKGTQHLTKGSCGSDNIGTCDKKNLILFSGDLDKVIATFIIANAAAAMGRQVSIFCTFWGLNAIRRPEKIAIKKDIMSTMFCAMMPRGSKKLKLSNMNMGGMGAKMIRAVMKNKNVDSLEDLIKSAMENGVEVVACSMSMDVMGIKEEELIDGVKVGGAAAMLANAEESDMSLFV